MWWPVCKLGSALSAWGLHSRRRVLDTDLRDGHPHRLEVARVSGTAAPRSLQVGSGSWDFPFKALFTLTQGHVGLLANVGYRVNTTDEGLKAGNIFSYD